MTTPTDAELEVFRDAFDWDGWSDLKAAQRAFARAFLAKWGQPQVVGQAGLQKAVFQVLEGWTLPHDVRKILETAIYTAPPPQAVREPRAEWALQALVAAGFVAQAKVDEALALYDGITQGGQHGAE